MEWSNGSNGDREIILSSRDDIWVGHLCYSGIRDGAFAKSENTQVQLANMERARILSSRLLDAYFNIGAFNVPYDDAVLLEQALPEMRDAHLNIRHYGMDSVVPIHVDEIRRIETAMKELSLDSKTRISGVDVR